MAKSIKLFIDGANNAQGCGWAVYLSTGTVYCGSIIKHTYQLINNTLSPTVINKQMTNGRAEMMAMVYALKYINDELLGQEYNITIIGDSTYTLNTCKEWIYNWIRKGILDKKANSDLTTIVAHYLEQTKKEKIKYIHQKAHVINPLTENEIGNNIADKYAVKACMMGHYHIIKYHTPEEKIPQIEYTNTIFQQMEIKETDDINIYISGKHLHNNVNKSAWGVFIPDTIVMRGILVPKEYILNNENIINTDMTYNTTSNRSHLLSAIYGLKYICDNLLDSDEKINIVSNSDYVLDICSRKIKKTKVNLDLMDIINKYLQIIEDNILVINYQHICGDSVGYSIVEQYTKDTLERQFVYKESYHLKIIENCIPITYNDIIKKNTRYAGIVSNYIKLQTCNNILKGTYRYSDISIQDYLRLTNLKNASKIICEHFLHRKMYALTKYISEELICDITTALYIYKKCAIQIKKEDINYEKLLVNKINNIIDILKNINDLSCIDNIITGTYNNKKIKSLSLLQKDS